MNHRLSRSSELKTCLMGLGVITFFTLLGCGGSASNPSSGNNEDSVAPSAAEVSSSSPQVGDDEGKTSNSVTTTPGPDKPNSDASGRLSSSSSGTDLSPAAQEDAATPTVAQGDPFKMLQTAMELEGQSR